MEELAKSNAEKAVMVVKLPVNKGALISLMVVLIEAECRRWVKK
jgi:hypothetical protein